MQSFLYHFLICRQTMNFFVLIWILDNLHAEIMVVTQEIRSYLIEKVFRIKSIIFIVVFSFLVSR